MGIFDMGDAFSNAVDNIMEGMMNDAMEQANEELEQYNENQKRPSIESLNFRRVPVEKAQQIRAVRTGLFAGGTKKKLAASIEAGKTLYTEVLAIAREWRNIDPDVDRYRYYDKDVNRYYYKLAAPDGTVLREDVPMLDDRLAIVFPLRDGDSVTDTGCADRVDPGEYREMLLLRCDLEGDLFYVLLTKEQMEDVTDLVKYGVRFWHIAEDGVGYLW